MTDTTDDGIEPLLRLLARLVHEAGFSGRALDRKLGYSRGQSNAILSGQQHLRFQNILDVLGALGIEPKDFFALLYWDSSEPMPPNLESIYRRQAGLPQADKTRPSRYPAEPEPDEEEDEERAKANPAIAQLLALVQSMIDDGIDQRLRTLVETARRKPGKRKKKPTEEKDV